ncbi:precorrin-2 C20-methyltransferase / precorrin-3B C17-methyltransferase [Nocardioides sp. YR527]|uniref:precorrin-3B C(17)-methyltransferase n=1 Tax=Nocardioides sp. YR527 TaxID=1881028 RepID=UPI0008816AD8|nr:precorrin-3B C(17)-methyltransferase [Nocardioides sp. YR527]SDK68835.1 precorrin-2 C20-methyltransferase / precorrin-3B C17-methyltransferase [Nocardioides sp. YR527]
MSTSSPGRFTVVGIGPGDPELITLKAARLIGAAPVIAYHAGVRKQSHARRIASSLIPADAVEEELRYPVTTGTTSHPGGYVGAMAEFYESCAVRLSAHLDAGRDVVLLAEGDPLFYGSSMYLHDRFKEVYETSVVPGVPAFAAATAAVSTPLVRQTDVLTVLPGTLPEPELARRLADTEAAIIMKLGRTFPAVRSALAAAGRLEGAWYVERASQPEERWLPVADVDPSSVPYFSLIVVPGDTAPAPAAARLRQELPAVEPVEVARGGVSTDSTGGEVLVVGLGPGPDGWLTPEVSSALAEVGHVVGYAPYVNRVPQREGLRRHASGNTVEVDRARHALELAVAGERVAVVSGGDAGVFGMASAVFEAAEDPAYAGVRVRVLPGVSAVQAVAARAGAPVGADFAVMSLSDRLKPWSVVEDRLRAVAAADLVLAIYNPASRSRTEQIGRARDVLLEQRKPDTVVVVGRDVGRAEESLTVTTLGDLDPGTIDMKCLVIVGASSTRATAAGQVWTPRYVR